MIDKKYIDLILDTVDLQEVVSDYGIALKVKGHRAWGCCPFHNEKTASFCVDTAKNLWFCHGACHEGGNGEPALSSCRQEAAEGKEEHLPD